jgi:hypothetical protein
MAIVGLESKASGMAMNYQLTNKAYLAIFFNENSIQDIFDMANQREAAFLLLNLLNIIKKKSEKQN